MILNGDGRFVLLSKPVAYPFSDIVNGTGEGPVFDLSVDLEFYTGVGYIKAEHIEEMARTLGMEYKKEAEPISAETNHDLESLINGMDVLLGAYRPLASPAISVPVYLSDIEPESNANAGTEPIQSEGTDKEPGKGETPIDGIVPDNSGKLKADGASKPAGKDGNASINKGPAKLSAGSDDGFSF